MTLHYVLKNKTMIEAEWQKCGEGLSQFIPISKAIRATVTICYLNDIFSRAK